MRPVNQFLALAVLPLCTAGCGVTVQNLTPQAMTRNPSGLYPIHVEVVRNNNSVLANTIQPYVVGPEQSFAMVPVAGATNRWEYTVAVPPQVTEWPYRFKVNYVAETWLVKEQPRTQIDPADGLVYVLRISDQTAVTLDARRGRIGSTVRVLGRGFTYSDQVLLNGQPVSTRFENENTLSFSIPVVAANQRYNVEVASGSRKLSCGDLLVDVSHFSISPATLTVPFEGTGSLEFSLPQPAPPGGLTVQIQNSNPAVAESASSFLLPEGQSRAMILLNGKHLGEGKLTFSATGFASATVPYRVVLIRSR